MSPATAKFLTFGLFSAVSLVAGYTARRRRWVSEELSRPIHFHTVVWIWSLATLLSLWPVKLPGEDLWLLLIQPVLMAAAAYGVIPLARWTGCTRPETGVMAVASAVGNHGFTLGSYLCYVLLVPSDHALAYSTAFATMTTICLVMIIYPLARRFSANPQAVGSWGQVLWRNFVDLRAMPMYAAFLGIVLAQSGVDRPEFVTRWHLVDVLFYAGGFGGYFGIGLRLHLAASARYLKQHAVVAIVKLMLVPAGAAALLWMLSQTGYPPSALASQVVQLQTAMPAAIITVMIANLFDLEPRMASALWVWNTALFAMISLPVILTLAA